MKTVRLVTNLALLLGWISLLNAQFTTVEHYTVANTVGPGISDEYIQRTILSPDGQIVCATSEGGISILEGNEWQNITTENGLPSDKVYDIIYDQEGTLWACTLFKLAYDSPQGWQIVDGISRPRFIIFDQVGHIWVGTETQGVYRNENDGTWTHFGISEGLPSETIHSLFADDQNNIWIGTQQGIAVFNGTEMTIFTVDDGLVNNRIYEIAQDEEGRIWAASWRDGISIFDGTQWIDQPTVSINRDMFLDASDTLWIATNQTVYSYKDGDLVARYSYYEYDMEAPITFSTIIVKPNGNKYIGTIYSGLLEINNDQSFELHQPQFRLHSNDIYAIRQDQEGIIWYAGKGGLSAIDNDEWSVFEFGVDHNIELVRKLYLDNYGMMWTSGNYGALQFDGLELVAQWNENAGLTDDFVSDLCQDFSNNYWFATYGGLSRYDGVNWMHITMADGLLDERLLHIECTSAGTVWFTSENNIYQYDEGTLTIFTPDDLSLDDPFIRCMMIDDADRVWVGTNRGLIKFEDNDFRLYGLSDGLPSQVIEAIVESLEEEIWVATINGIARLTGDGFINYDESDGLPALGSLRTISFDQDGFLWLAINGNGVFRVDISTNANEVTEGKSIKLYPNPMSDQFTLESDNPIKTIIIYDLNGRELFYKEVQGVYGEKIQVRPDLQAGTYLCQVRTESGIYSQKLVIAEY